MPGRSAAALVSVLARVRSSPTCRLSSSSLGPWTARFTPRGPGSHHRVEGAAFAGTFLRFTVTGYAIVFLVSLYILWTFGQLEGTAPAEILGIATVLSFPGAIGASVARLIV